MDGYVSQFTPAMHHQVGASYQTVSRVYETIRSFVSCLHVPSSDSEMEGSPWRYDVLFVLYRLTKKCMGPVQQRALSGADAVNALRPFYFAVHPDFFAQYPKERVGVR